jgi:hypothetical protein
MSRETEPASEKLKFFKQKQDDGKGHTYVTSMTQVFTPYSIIITKFWRRGNIAIINRLPIIYDRS